MLTTHLELPAIAVIFKLAVTQSNSVLAIVSTPELNEKIVDMSKKIQLSVAFLSLIIIFTFPVLVKLWLGDDYNTITLVYIVVLAVAYLLFSPPIFPIYYYLQSKSMLNF